MMSTSSWLTTPSLLILHDWDLDTFGVDVGRDLTERAADIEPMRHAAGECDQLALVKTGIVKVKWLRWLPVV